MENPKSKVRYAVVGLGHIAQVAVLPAFKHAKRNSTLVSIVTDDQTKRREIAKKYRLDQTYSYREYERCLEEVDAVYIALPNSLHAEYTIRAAKAGVHVLCEKPMAVTVNECRRMIDACKKNRVKLMVAYRLHFEEINLNAIDLVRKGQIGEPKFFNSSFSMTVRPGNIRTQADLGASVATGCSRSAMVKNVLCVRIKAKLAGHATGEATSYLPRQHEKGPYQT